MKYFIAIVLTLISCKARVFSQTAPSIQWQKTLGGSSWDFANSIRQTTDKGYIVAGYTSSNDEDVTGNHGNEDYWIVKLDAAGNKVWQKTLGGSGNDEAHSIQQTTEGGYIVAGFTESNDGDVTGNHGNTDYWIVKLDADGNIIWQKTFGGYSYDEAHSIQQTSDGGYIVAGYTFSINGNVTGNHGGSDYWIVKLNANGKIIWQKTLGGSSYDYANSIQQTKDGGYVVAGRTSSNDGDVTGHHPAIIVYDAFDEWIVKLDADGNKIWQKILGGYSYDEAHSIQQTRDGGYIVAGITNSNNGDVTGNHGNADYWIVKLNARGKIIWQKTLGGSSYDEALSIQQTKDGYIVAGYTASNNGDVTGFHGGNSDYWIVKLDTSENIIWQKTFGGSSWDNAYSIRQTSNGGYIVAGVTSSNDGDVTGHHGIDTTDYWIVKLTAPCSPVTPAINIAASPGISVCKGSKVTFRATATNGGSAPVYQWRKNGIKVGTNSKTYVDSILKNGDSIYCRLTSNAACATPVTVKSNGIKMTIKNPRIPAVNIAATPASNVCKGSKVTFTATATNGGTAPVYKWKKNGIKVGTNSKTYVDSTLKNGDSIFCILTSNAACVTLTTVKSNGIKMIVRTCLFAGNNNQSSVKGQSKELSLIATPNPIKNSVQLTIVSPVSVRAVILISHITGQKVFTQNVLLNQGTNIIPVESTGWSAGTYYVQVSTIFKTKSYKIIKQ